MPQFRSATCQPRPNEGWGCFNLPVSLLETGNLPIPDLARLAMREGVRPRPIYQAHKWFARRFGSVFRALLVAAALPADADFWQAYYDGVDLSGTTVLDPFVGGGTAVVEAQRLGADVIGVDVDSVACAITHFETRAATMPELDSHLDRLKREVGTSLGEYYRSTDEGGAPVDVLHYFWVQVVGCRACGSRIEAHPHYQLAYDAEGTVQWAFCPQCHEPHVLDRSATQLKCRECGAEASIQTGTVCRGRLTCPQCGASERLIDVGARTGRPPEWRLFALEILEPAMKARRPLPLAMRTFRAATSEDQAVFDAATTALGARTSGDGTILGIPEYRIPIERRSDDRLPRYGYAQYRELFNARQLLHLSFLGEAIAALDGEEREALALAFSNHLTTNCMMTSYAFGWRRAVPLFSVRAFRHITRPVEINPWLDGTGRGTFPNAVRQVQRAIAFARAPYEPLLSGGFQRVTNLIPNDAQASSSSSVRVFHQSATVLDGVTSASVDLVLTDPPYFDNIAYSELADFFLPWLQQLGLVRVEQNGPIALDESIAAKNRSADALESYQTELGRCFFEMARVLKQDGRLVFTYQHREAGAWHALGAALAGAGFRAVQVIPMLGDTWRSLHTHSGSSKWDAVFVMVKTGGSARSQPSLTDGAATAALHHCRAWSGWLSEADGIVFRDADERNFFRACLVAATLGLFDDGQAVGDLRSLAEVLAVEPDSIGVTGVLGRAR